MDPVLLRRQAVWVRFVGYRVMRWEYLALVLALVNRRVDDRPELEAETGEVLVEEGKREEKGASESNVDNNTGAVVLLLTLSTRRHVLNPLGLLLLGLLVRQTGLLSNLVDRVVLLSAGKVRKGGLRKKKRSTVGSDRDVTPTLEKHTDGRSESSSTYAVTYQSSESSTEERRTAVDLRRLQHGWRRDAGARQRHRARGALRREAHAGGGDDGQHPKGVLWFRL